MNATSLVFPLSKHPFRWGFFPQSVHFFGCSPPSRVRFAGALPLQMFISSVVSLPSVYRNVNKPQQQQVDCVVEIAFIFFFYLRQQRAEELGVLEYTFWGYLE